MNQNVPLILPGRRPIEAPDSNPGQTEPPTRLTMGKGEFNKGGYLMKTTKKTKRRVPVLLSIICAGLVATFLGGCAESPYVAYDTGYYPAGYYRTYSYYGYPTSYYYTPAYDTTIVRSGVRYNDAYGPRYYGSNVYGDWY
ncbi:MAG: hypothetical protein DMF26_03685 [Verrucomicrobia bacterium]|nr:MAG: hypothetical protein DMF26_03685 [Verrucomicrobiota bacterium]